MASTEHFLKMTSVALVLGGTAQHSGQWDAGKAETLIGRSGRESCRSYMRADSGKDAAAGRVRTVTCASL